MAISLPARRRRGRRRHEVHKPTGALHPRVETVGPEHFGIVSVECAKTRSKWMLADFFGNVLIEPVVVPHTRDGFRAAIARLRQAIVDHYLDDLIVAVERIGRYHLPVKRAFTGAGYEARTVHPFATRQFRLRADPGNKTDETYLSAIHRAAVNGFGLTDRGLDDVCARNDDGHMPLDLAEGVDLPVGAGGRHEGHAAVAPLLRQRGGSRGGAEPDGDRNGAGAYLPRGFRDRMPCRDRVATGGAGRAGESSRFGQ
jgi:hypothetical protein